MTKYDVPFYDVPEYDVNSSFLQKQESRKARSFKYPLKINFIFKNSQALFSRLISLPL